MCAYSRMNRPIVVVDYDPNWPTLYEVEKAHILGALGAAVLQIEQIGSTSVPGLSAKPVIDIAVGIAALSQASIYIPALEALGYVYVPEVEAALPSRRFLWKGTPLVHTYHLSLAEPDDPTMVNPIIFRNYLRAYPDEAQRYQVLKRELAARCGSDVNAYVADKTALVESVLAKAAEAT